mmetsp:Transcript_24768/g.32354  ORF Transcript_24768/g.32354 Transcript_24768/m.32354 type:complete len:105 (-) Transcript_24768:1050-1364(-)
MGQFTCLAETFTQPEKRSRLRGLSSAHKRGGVTHQAQISANPRHNSGHRLCMLRYSITSTRPARSACCLAPTRSTCEVFVWSHSTTLRWPFFAPRFIAVSVQPP